MSSNKVCFYFLFHAIFFFQTSAYTCHADVLPRGFGNMSRRRYTKVVSKGGAPCSTCAWMRPSIKIYAVVRMQLKIVAMVAVH